MENLKLILSTNTSEVIFLAICSMALAISFVPSIKFVKKKRKNKRIKELRKTFYNALHSGVFQVIDSEGI